MSDSFDVPTEISDVTIVGPLPVPVTGTFTPSGTQDVNIISSIPLAVTGPLTDTELRASPVPVTIPTPVPVTQSTTPWITDGSGTVQPISGTIAVSNFPATQPISGTVTANQGTPAITANAWPIKLTDGTDTADITAAGALKVDGSAVTQPISGTVSITATAGTATVTRVATSTTVATALAANASRTGLIINTEAGTTYVKFGSTATTTDYTAELAANSYFDYQGYKGNVTVIRATGTGNIQVTEII